MDSIPDLRYGVRTGGYHPLAAILPAKHHGEDCVWYQPTPWSVARAALKGLQIQYDEFCFLDYGSGKGRVLLAASQFPFRRVLGVELSPTLHNIALRNISIWTSKNLHKVVPQSICMDAREYPVPLEPIVAFMFTPFKGLSFDSVIRKLTNHTRNSMPTIIVYYGSHEVCLHRIRALRWYECSLPTPRNLIDLKRYPVYYFSKHAGPLRLLNADPNG